MKMNIIGDNISVTPTDIAVMMKNVLISNEIENDVIVMAKYEVAEKVARELIKMFNPKLELMELEVPKVSNYDNEYYVTLTKDNLIFVEKAWHDEYTTCTGKVIPSGYVCCDSELLFVNGDVNIKDLKEAMNDKFLDNDDKEECSVVVFDLKR